MLLRVIEVSRENRHFRHIVFATSVSLDTNHWLDFLTGNNLRRATSLSAEFTRIYLFNEARY